MLRLLTMAVRLALAAGLISLVVKHRPALARPAWVVWALIAVSYTILALDNTTLELLTFLRRDLPEDAPLERFYYAVYHFTYLLHALLNDALPAATIVVLVGPGRTRYAFGAVTVGAVGVAVVGLLAGTQESWDVLLRFTRVLSFIGIGGYLAFWALFFLGRVPRAGIYLAGFLGVQTVFELLLPVQEVFFQMVGRGSADEIWYVLQFLQLAAASAHLGIVLVFTRALGSGRPIVPAPAGR